MVVGGTICLDFEEYFCCRKTSLLIDPKRLLVSTQVTTITESLFDQVFGHSIMRNAIAIILKEES